MFTIIPSLVGVPHAGAHLWQRQAPLGGNAVVTMVLRCDCEQWLPHHDHAPPLRALAEIINLRFWVFRLVPLQLLGLEGGQAAARPFAWLSMSRHILAEHGDCD